MRNQKAALLHLQKDPVLKTIIDQFGPLNYHPGQDYFDHLVSSIIGQQLSNKAADTIYGRFISLFPNQKFTADLILATPQDKLRGIGTSWAKARSLHDLSQKVLDGTLQLNKLDKMTDEEVIEHLIQVKGIGRWSAEMQLMFSLHRPDILPLDDVGIQNAFVKLYNLSRTDNRELRTKMQEIASFWRPWRTVACWYLWKSLDNSSR